MPARKFKANLRNILPEGASAGPSHRWFFADFFDKVLMANTSLQPYFWPGSGDARPIPGLPDTTGWAGVTVVSGHPVLWRDDQILVGALNDFTMWIPVGATASTARANTLDDFVMPDADATTDWVAVDRTDVSFFPGQYVRVEVNPDDATIADYNFFLVEEVSGGNGVSALSAKFAQTINAGQEGFIFLQDFVEFKEGGYLAVNGQATDLLVIDARETERFSEKLSSTSLVPAINATTILHFPDPDTGGPEVGDCISVATTQGTESDLYEITEIQGTLKTARRLGIGSNQKASGSFTESSPSYYATGAAWLKVRNVSLGNISISAETSVTTTSSLKLKNLGYTGSQAPGTIVPAGVVVDSVVANTAAAIINAGDRINGEIFAIVSIGEYGYILKEKSIQSMQSIEVPGSPFAIRFEAGEGPISRNAWGTVSVENKVAGVVFVGSSNIYVYSGGQNFSTVAESHRIEFFEELDRSRVDEITVQQMPHYQQVWIAYPTKNSVVKKVLILNYNEQTLMIDSYEESLGGLTAFGVVDWELAPTWMELVGTWDEQTLRWFELSEEGEKQYAMIGVASDEANPTELGEVVEEDEGVPRLLAHGRVFTRASSSDCLEEGYVAFAETQDFDFGQPDVFKYVDTVQVEVEVRNEIDEPVKLYCQVGGRTSLDATIRWSEPADIDVRGNMNQTSDFSIRASGRYVRLKFWSSDPGAKWKIGGYSISARIGGAY